MLKQQKIFFDFLRFCIGAAEEIPESAKDADWNGQSSLVKWLSDKGVCVLIDSLSDIPNAVNGISEDKYSEMVDNARNLGEMLRQEHCLSLY